MLSNENNIIQFFHCSLCLVEKPKGVSPSDWARLSIGSTVDGIQVWCVRHNANVLHVNFEGMIHPTDFTRRPIAIPLTGRTQQLLKEVSKELNKKKGTNGINTNR